MSMLFVAPGVYLYSTGGPKAPVQQPTKTLAESELPLRTPQSENNDSA